MNWSFQTQVYAHAHRTTPVSQIELSPYQIVFIYTLDLNLTNV